MTQINTADATGAALDWLVAKCEGHSLPPFPGRNGRKECWINVSPSGHDNFDPSADWSQGGPIIKKEGISITNKTPTHWWAALGDVTDEETLGSDGPTPLIAAMRCFVSSRLGEVVEVPDELA